VVVLDFMPLKTPSTRRVQPDEPIRILSIGGGTGLSTLLQGLKYYVKPELRTLEEQGFYPTPSHLRFEVTAVVTVTDDGGSSGRLRRDFDVLPPGDIRNCMVALSEDAALLAKLFQYRFAAGRGLKGHSFGNLFLTALTQLNDGDFARAIKQSSEVLAIAGSIFPSTSSSVVLQAKLRDGTKVTGESLISRSRSPIERISIRPRRPKPLADTLRAIEEADLITLGPGSLFTSVIPNLLVDGIPNAIRQSSALKAYFCNLMWQPGETTQYRASDHVEAIHKHSGGSLLDCIVVNTKPYSAPLRKRYALQEAKPVEVDYERLNHMGLRVMGEDLLARLEKARHDSHRAAAVAIQLALMGRRRRHKAQMLRQTASSA
jgi:uncharacterized cofD-like protein